MVGGEWSLWLVHRASSLLLWYLLDNDLWHNIRPSGWIMTLQCRRSWQENDFQDKYDDAILGVKSTAIKFGEQTPVCLSCFATAMLSCLAYCGLQTGQTWPYYASLLGVTGHLMYQIRTLDINNREDCARKFTSNRWVGLTVFLGLSLGTLMKEKDREPLRVQDIVEEAARVVQFEEAWRREVPKRPDLINPSYKIGVKN